MPQLDPTMAAKVAAVEIPGEDELQWVADHANPVDWKELLTTVPTEPDWLVPDFLIRGSSYALVSKAKSGKSLLMLDVCCALAAGTSALGNPAREPAKVLYIDLENTERDLAARVNSLGYTHQQLSGQLTYLSFPTLAALDTARGGEQVAATAWRFEADVVVIDTLSRVVEGDENESHTYQQFYRHAVVPLKRRGVTVVRLDHLGKDSTKGARGSSAKNDDIDAQWLLDLDTQKAKNSDQPDKLWLRMDLQRSGDHPQWLQIARHRNPLRHTVANKDAGDTDRRPGDDTDPLKERVIAALQHLGAEREPKTLRELTEFLFPEVVGASKLDRQNPTESVRHHLTRLVDEGWVRKGTLGPGKGAAATFALVPESRSRDQV